MCIGLNTGTSSLIGLAGDCVLAPMRRADCLGQLKGRERERAKNICYRDCYRTRWHGLRSERTGFGTKGQKAQIICHFLGLAGIRWDGRSRIRKPVLFPDGRIRKTRRGDAQLNRHASGVVPSIQPPGGKSKKRQCSRPVRRLKLAASCGRPSPRSRTPAPYGPRGPARPL